MSDHAQEFSERRKHKRIPKSFVVRLKPKAAKEWDIVFVINLSAGGLLFNYPKSLKENELLEFKINIGLDSKPILCHGKVVRCASIGHPPIFSIAAFFTDITQEAVQEINEISNKVL